ncbi:MAG TPA: SGNH/GDSL hydrolase family protein [Candidatus Acidoferrum sp.]|nr:SGNH/GDSL hydrolase family protein [Candidatus Acidoferrum sp.]
MRAAALALITVLLIAGGTARAQSDASAFEQNRKLGRGVNILGYDPIWRSRDRARFQAKHFRLLKEAGFDSVRINLAPFRSMSATNGYALRESWLGVLDWALTEAKAQGLRVILDLHEYGAMGNDPEGNKEKFLAFWQQAAAKYQHEPDSVYFEVLNEPCRKLTPALWNQYLAEALAIIRQTNPTRTVIIGPAFWNSLEHLHELELPENDRNLIVTVHYYLPMSFTHQGASWTDRAYKTGVEWQGTEAELDTLKTNFDKVETWAKEHNRPVFVGEFGAYDRAPMDSRARYVASVARAAEQRGWSWAYWQFDSDFILYDMARDGWVEPLLAALIPPGSRSTSGPPLRWTDAHDLSVEGRGWENTQAFYDRLPAKAEGQVPAKVWDLSHKSAGELVRFVTDAQTISVRWALTSPTLAMPHMSATGVSGVDLYVKTEAGRWRWLAVGQPRQQTNEVVLAKGLKPGRREYMLYLPLYNGTARLEIGVPAEAALTIAGPWGSGKRKPIVFYGTSILQGACASRPGMVHSAILGRRFDYPTINLGFSGAGRMELVMAGLLAELDPSVYVLDCLPNMNAQMVTERVEPFVRTLRQAHPTTPIVLVEDRRFPDGFLVASKCAGNDANHAALRAAFKRLKKSGVRRLYYIPGDSLLGEDGEGTVDSSHPNDLGFMRQAEAFARVLGPLLPQGKSRQ